MTTRELARFFVRFQAFCFLFYAVYEFTGFGSVYRDYTTIHEFAVANLAAASAFWILMSRFTLQLGAAIFLFCWTEKVIDFVAKGVWSNGALEPDGKGLPNKPPLPRPGESPAQTPSQRPGPADI